MHLGRIHETQGHETAISIGDVSKVNASTLVSTWHCACGEDVRVVALTLTCPETMLIIDDFISGFPRAPCLIWSDNGEC